MRRILLILALCGLAHADPLITSPYDWMRVDAQMNQSITNYVTHSGVLSLNPGWQFVQEATPNPCSGTSCTTPADCSLVNCLAPLIVGDVVVIALIGGNTNTTISGVTGSSGTTWANAGCHAFQTGVDNIDIEYTLAVSTSVQQLTVNFAGTSLGSGYLDITELKPPAGHTATFDGCAHNTPTTCTGACVGGAPTVTGTDAILQEIDCSSICPTAPTSWSSPYLGTLESTGLCLNCPSGTAAPTVAISSSFSQNIVGIAFKTDAGAFTAPTTPTLVHYSLPTPSSFTNCSPTCTPAITSTAAGHLLFVTEGDDTSGTPTMTITGLTAPAGCHKGGATGNKNLNCAYLLSSGAGTTSLSVTMSINSIHTAFGVSEWACPSGTWHFDTSAGTLNPGSLTFLPAGQALTTTDNNDLVIQAIAAGGGVDGSTFYPFPWFDGQPNGTVLTTADTTWSNAFSLNVGPAGSIPAPAWVYPGTTTTTTTAVFGAGFSCF